MFDALSLQALSFRKKQSYTSYFSVFSIIFSKFHYFIRAVLEKNLPLQEYILKFMQFAEENKDTIVIADEIGNGIVPIDAFERAYREQTGRAEILLAKKADEVVRVICGIGQKIK